jgi:DNA-binding beta-propeller fold protein YncE
VDSSGNIYVADRDNNRIQKFDKDGNFLRMWGFGVQDGKNEFQICTNSTKPCRAGIGGRGDGQFGLTNGVAADISGNVYVLDNGRFSSEPSRIQVFNSQGNFLFKFGSDGLGISTDGKINIYVADSFNNRIQVFDATGKFLFQFGSFGTGDGQFRLPGDVAVDSAGNIIVTEIDNHRVQKFDSGGNFLFKFGSLGSGDGQFNNPRGVAVDSLNIIHVLDRANQRVQLFDPSGNFLFKFGSAGSGDGQFSGVGAIGIAVDKNRFRIYVADTFNHRIQVFQGISQGEGGGGTDKDGDGVDNELDIDSDNDGIPNSIELPAEILGAGSPVEVSQIEEGILDNPDEDGIPNELDLDSDGDGIPDVIEAGGEDEDGDGMIDDFTDANENGLADIVEEALGGLPLPLPDTDGDGVPDFLDSNSDGDRPTDVREAGGVDDNGDGILDDLLDENGDGLADSVQTSAGGEPLPLLDLDEDGVPDFLDSNQATGGEGGGGGGGCSIASVGPTSSLPLYLLLPVFVIMRRLWRRYGNKN